MESSSKALLEKLSNRKRNEMAHFAKYKEEGLRDLLLISSGKILEIDYMINELKLLIKRESKFKKW